MNGPIVEAFKAAKAANGSPEDEDDEAMDTEDDKNNASFDDKEVNDDLNNILNQVIIKFQGHTLVHLRGL